LYTIAMHKVELSGVAAAIDPALCAKLSLYGDPAASFDLLSADLCVVPPEANPMPIGHLLSSAGASMSRQPQLKQDLATTGASCAGTLTNLTNQNDLVQSSHNTALLEMDTTIGTESKFCAHGETVAIRQLATDGHRRWSTIVDR